MGRGDIIKETTLTIFNAEEDSRVWNPPAMVSIDHKPIEASKIEI
mgnify:CR=1 FL=1